MLFSFLPFLRVVMFDYIGLQYDTMAEKPPLCHIEGFILTARGWGVGGGSLHHVVTDLVGPQTLKSE